MPLSIDVAVVAFNRYDVTSSRPRHLRDPTRERRLLVCENGSTDETAEPNARHGAAAAHVIRTDDNSGFGETCNAAVAFRTGGAIALLNNDVDCRPDLLGYDTPPLERDPVLGPVDVLRVPPDGEQIDSIGLTTDATLSGFPQRRGVYAHYER